MRAHHDALAALDTEVLVPHRDELRDIALFPLRGARGEGAAGGDGADREQISMARCDLAQHVVHEFGSLVGDHSDEIEIRRDSGWQFNFFEVRERRVDGREVFLHHGFAALAIGLLDGLLDLLDRLVARKHAADCEEAGLHDGVDARAHTGFARHCVSIDDVELNLLLQHLLLHSLGELVPHFSRGVRRVEEEDRAWHGCLKHVHLLEEAEVVAGHEAGVRDQVAGANRRGTEAQVRRGHGAGLLRVVHKVALRVVGRLRADDLDGVLVGAHRSVGAQSVEESTNGAGLFSREAGIVGEAGVADIVVNADGEVILRRGLGQLVVDALDHGGREFL